MWVEQFDIDIPHNYQIFKTVLVTLTNAAGKFLESSVFNPDEIKDEKPLIYIFGLLLFAISILPKNYAISKIIENFIYNYMVIIFSICLGISILVLAYIKKKKKKEIQTNNESSM